MKLQHVLYLYDSLKEMRSHMKAMEKKGYKVFDIDDDLLLVEYEINESESLLKA